MKKDNVNYFLVGCFVLGMLAILLVALYKITGHSGDTDAYLVRFKNINGISPSTVVTYEGYPVGRIGRINHGLQDSRTVYDVELLIRSGWKIPKDSVAHIMSVSLLSDFTVDIREGQSQETLQVGAVMQGRELEDVFAAMAEVAADVGDLTGEGLKPLLASLTRSVESVGGTLETEVPALLKRSDSILAKLEDSADALNIVLGDGNVAHINSLLKNADTTSSRLLALTASLDQSRAEFDKLLTGSNALLEDSSPDLRRSVTQLRDSLDVIGQHIDEIVANLNSTSRNMQEFSRQLRNNPGLLLGGSAPKDSAKGGQ